MNSSEVAAKFGSIVLSFSYDVCLEVREKGEDIHYFKRRMREKFPTLTDEDLGSIFNYSMMETR